MENIFLICVDDQREVLSALMKDLSILENFIDIEECESADEAWGLIEKIDNLGDHLALIISDQVMPHNTGVDLLKKINLDRRFSGTRKILLTGLATHQDTIEAINLARLDNYIEKPWDKASLLKIVKSLLTRFMIEKGIDYKEYLDIVDSETLYQLLKEQTG